LIVIFVDNIEDFLKKEHLEKRVMDEIFYEIKEVKNEMDISTKTNSEIVLHYLAKVSDRLILYETKQDITKSRNSEKEVIQALQKIFNQVNPSLKFCKGKIREIFLSYSS